MRTTGRISDTLRSDRTRTDVDDFAAHLGGEIVVDEPVDATAPRRAHIGDVLAGRYELETCVGENPFGQVFVARNLALRTRVTVHVFEPALAAELAGRERLRRDAEALASVSHRHVARVVDFVSADHTFLVTEDLSGTSLAQLLAADRRPEWARATRIVLRLARALEAVHAAGIVHGGVEPSNIVLADDDMGEDDPRLVGFCATGWPVSSGDAWTWTDVAAWRKLGLVASDHDGDATHDVYRLGCVLYELVTGARPTRAMSVTKLSRTLRGALSKPGAPTEMTARMAVCAVIERSIHPATERRFQSARALGDALQAALGLASAAAVATGRARLAPRAVVSWILVGMTAVAVAALSAFECARLTTH
jgi:serine/threonine-protein kinase